MRIRMEKKHWIVLGLGVFLLIISLIYMYLTTVKPIKAEQDRLAEEVSRLENEMAANHRNEAVSAGAEASERFALKQKLPLEPLQDQFLLIIDRAEEMSESHVLSAVYLENDPKVQGEETEEDVPELDINIEDDPVNEEEETVPDMDTLPEEVGHITYQFVVQSPSYENAERFIERMDESIRLLKIHSLIFSGQEEWIWREEEPDPLTFNMVVTAYFYNAEEEE